MRPRPTLISAVLALLLVPTAAAAAPPDDSNGNRTVTDVLFATCEDGLIMYDGPVEIWPPNHKYVDAVLSFVPDADSMMMYEYVAAASHDQVIDGEEQNGSGNTPLESDITLEGGMYDGAAFAVMGMEMAPTPVDLEVQVRAERSGRDQAGRTYTIAGMVMGFGGDDEDDDGAADMMMDMTCEFAFEITVPHDQGGGNDQAAAMARASWPTNPLASLAFWR